MPRYVRQRDKYSCGPIAIINAIKWAGGHATVKKDHKRLVRTTNCSVMPKGVFRSNFDRVLRHEGRWIIKVTRRLRPGIKAIEEHVRKDDCVTIVNNCFLGQETGELYAHFTLYVDASPSGKTFTCVNYFREGPAVAQFRRSTIIGDLRSHFVDFPCVWFLTRLNK